tara:strand:+ start:3361 stop:3618 length:258 start_codon:yes stop_codon:yes gene_type:complete
MNLEINKDSELKEIIVNYVGNKTNPKDDEVTLEHIAEIFSEEFPEFLLTLAEENWINGYTQALNDVDFVKNEMKKQNVTEELNQE